ncbi:MAG: TRAP transporter permease [Geminicoccaceae bacterium]
MATERDGLDQDALDKLERRYDSALNLRPIGLWVSRAFYLVAIVFALYHYAAAGFGVPVDYWHMGLHLTGLFFLIFIGFPFLKTEHAMTMGKPSWLRPGNVPLYDWLCALLGSLSALYLGFSWLGLEIDFLGFAYSIPEQALRQGNPVTSDIFFGTILVVLVLEIARRTLGPILPCIILVFVAYALLGPYIPVQILKHPGVDWRQFINNMYFPQEGIFGVTLWVVSTIVFHFVLFGVVAQRMGLGQFFIDNAMILAGRYTGGPAKVSVVSSAFFGTISGSSIANTVSTGSLTIPNMKRMGYPGHFAGGVEAAASAGGQITPPIMGAASFVMAEFLEVPYTTIVIAAIVPALMHYVGVLSIVHLEAKRLNLPSYTKDQLPQLAAVWKEGWPTILPLIVLIYVLFSGYTPYMAAFLGITLCLIVGYSTLKQPLTLVIPLGATAFTIWKTMQGTFAPELTALLLVCIVVGLLNPRPRQSFASLGDSMHVAVQYALAVGAAGAAVGIVVGVINTTGIGFRMGFLVTNGAAQMAEVLYTLVYWVPGEIFSVPSIQLFLSLVLIAIACILMGAGLPTTALYIMLASVAQPTLAQLGVPPLASHMFVLYYGVISEITPPVCASAYAAAGIAGANPFRTGLSAFSLGLGKLVVPMVFVYAPTMLIMLPEHFTLASFLQVSITCALGVFTIAVAITGFLWARLGPPMRLLFAAAGLLLVAPGTQSDLVGLALVALLILGSRAFATRQEAA